MLKYSYDIVMETPLGKKKGTMHLNISNGKIKGSLNILRKENPFTGEVLMNGTCNLNGCIETIVSLFEYLAKGYLDKETINLTLYTRKNVFNISGTALGNEKEGD